MNQLTTNRNWLTLLVVFIAGILIGLIVLGWGLFPVKWTNANLRDLREGAQNNYLSAVADSYTANRDLNLAQDRLKEWTPNETRILLDKLAARYGAEGRIQQVQSLQTLADAVQAAPAAQPTATPAAAKGAIQLNSNLLMLLGLLLGVIILGAGLGLLAWWIVKPRQQASTPPESSLPFAEPPPVMDTHQPGRSPVAAPSPFAFQDETTDDRFEDVEDTEDLGDGGEEIGSYEAPAPPSPTAPGYRPAPPMPGFEGAAQSPTPASPPAVSLDEPLARSPLGFGKKLAEFDAVYHRGDADYDEAFVVDGDTGGAGFRGECGMGIAMPLDSESTQATALEVWLFDKSNIRTVTTVLASDYAYNMPSLQERLAERGDILLAAPNQVFTIEAKTLVLQGEVTSLTYVEGAKEPRSVFDDLAVHLTIYTPEE